MTGHNVALLQLCSGADAADNLRQIEQQLRQLSSAVKLVLTPENALLFSNPTEYRRQAEQHDDGPLQLAIRNLVRKYGVWLLLGSMPLISREDPAKITSSSLLFDAQGELRARYDKLHLFDVDIADKHGRYRESDSYQHGQHIVVVDTPIGKLGMAICYDLRFPGLFQLMREQGAEIIALPAAFTWRTGEMHWEILLRARAIETQSFVLAVNQSGWHDQTRRTWGHSMIIDPWGKILVQSESEIAPLSAAIDMQELAILRQQMPVMQHNRLQSGLINPLMKSDKHYESDTCQ